MMEFFNKESRYKLGATLVGFSLPFIVAGSIATYGFHTNTSCYSLEEWKVSSSIGPMHSSRKFEPIKPDFPIMNIHYDGVVLIVGNDTYGDNYEIACKEGVDENKMVCQLDGEIEFNYADAKPWDKLNPENREVVSLGLDLLVELAEVMENPNNSKSCLD